MLIAVDIGNSRIKLGQFDGVARCEAQVVWRSLPLVGTSPPEPTATLELPLGEQSREFDVSRLASWCGKHAGQDSEWSVASVNRRAAERFARAVADSAEQAGCIWPLRPITFRDVPLTIDVEQPARVGIDRLLSAVAVNRFRTRDRAAIVVDSGSAMTIDLVSADGVFRGGAILPGMTMSARALAEQTDALPRIAIADRFSNPGDSESPCDSSSQPAALGKSTGSAIEAGLFWGTVGAIREVVHQFSSDLERRPDIFITGGTSPRFAKLLAESQPLSVRYKPHLVLTGIALVKQFEQAS